MATTEIKGEDPADFSHSQGQAIDQNSCLEQNQMAAFTLALLWRKDYVDLACRDTIMQSC